MSSQPREVSVLVNDNRLFGLLSYHDSAVSTRLATIQRVWHGKYRNPRRIEEYYVEILGDYIRGNKVVILEYSWLVVALAG